jgi:hypothetical protein
VKLGRLLEAAPDLSTYQQLDAAPVLQWIGRAQALVDRANVGVTAMEFNAAVNKFPYSNWETGVQEVFRILHRVIAVAELHTPADVAGTFIPVGSQFDAFAAISKLLKPATKDVFIVDPYLDESVLTDFGAAVPDGVPLRLLADAAGVRPSLAPAATAWVKQHGGSRPLSLRVAAARTLHDRAIFIDGTTAWTITQSLKDFAKRAPAEVVRVDDIALLKIPAYESIWAGSAVVC